MSRKKIVRSNLPPTDVDGILAQHKEGLKAQVATRQFGRAGMYYSSYAPWDRQPSPEEIAKEENRLRLREMSIGTETAPNNSTISSRQRKAARATVRSAQSSGKKRR